MKRGTYQIQNICEIAIKAFILLGIFFADFCYLYAGEPTLQIEGTFSMLAPAGKEAHFTDFTLLLSGNKYQVSDHYFNGELLVSGSDGTNSYFVNKMTKAKNLITNWWEWGSVSPGQFPAKDLTPGQLCWLAFASSDYFRAQTNSTLPLEAFQQNAEFFHNNLMLSTNQPRLPLSIKWYGTNFWYLRTTNIADRITIQYTNGFLAGEYIVTSTTNFESFELPLSFDLDVFIPFFDNKNMQTEDVTLVQSLRGRINNIKQVKEITDFRPALGSRAQIADFRIPSATNGNYLRITRLNGKWPEPGDADFARTIEVARLINIAAAPPPSHKFVKVGIFVFMVSSFFILVFIVRQTTKKERKHENCK